jgi:hypothetical protein
MEMLETVGSVEQVPPMTRVEVIGVIIASLKTATTCVGTEVRVPVEGLRLTSVGAAPDVGVALGVVAGMVPKPLPRHPNKVDSAAAVNTSLNVLKYSASI